MLDPAPCTLSCISRYLHKLAFLLLILTVWSGLQQRRAHAQDESSGGDLGSCTLRDHVYTCDGAAFQRALASANTASVKAHNADGVARAQLTDLVTKKLGKTLAPEGSQADLMFLMIPVGDEGEVNYNSGRVTLGTLRIYTVAPAGTSAHLLWAETFSGQPDMPWPAVVRGLILQFQSRFNIK